jgi:hypothetical protein
MSTTTAVRRRASVRRRAAACAFGLLVLLVRPAVASAPVPQRVVVGDLRGKTTITWSGMAAIRLRVPRDVSLPAATAFRLTVRTGRYVSIRGFENPQPIGCKLDHETWCSVTWIDWLRDLEQTSGHGLNKDDPSRDFAFGEGAPPLIIKGGWDLYLFTDGTATLEITAKGLAGRASYRAAGRFTGRAVHVRTGCALPQCLAGPVYADHRTGGAAFDIGRMGFVQAMTYGGAQNSTVAGAGTQEVFSLRTCMYPSKAAPDASSDPKAHPDGCDTVPASSVADSTAGTIDSVGSAGPTGGRILYTQAALEGHNRMYLGLRAAAVGYQPARIGGLFVWIRYGIR